ncbi:hypothetical protein M3649_04380 [Ureibacillus chungkukjangi]|uniref:hypothetical protein n=1 Tax=Ureibacillus chungkukjangi TaxID=1202712 RepID=UPI002041FF36|nr:hypothetical protein [Ureibacillus chungkukjangi]MCM3387371.1 hypothetical protein [Ureibacillus chungkukjangi]
MAWIRSEEEVEEIIQGLLTKGKPNHITQSVLFKKNSEQQLDMLRHVLRRSTSFGEYMRQLIINDMNGTNNTREDITPPRNEQNIPKKDMGNFF